MKSFLQLFYLMILLTMFSFTEINAQNDSIPGSFKFEGHTRIYWVYLPDNFQPNMPVVLNLHGYYMSIKNQAKMSLMHEYADTLGFIIVYPSGSGSPIGWNNGLRDSPYGSTDTTSNDVGFIFALIDTLHAHYDIDLSRVYCCGFSMGGEMTYRLAIEFGQRFAAIASVAGKLNDVSGNIGTPLRPYPVLHVHGTEDLVEYYGPGAGNFGPLRRR